MEYRGIRYTVRTRTERQEWHVAIHPEGVERPGRVVAGSRDNADSEAHAMIDAWFRRHAQIRKRRPIDKSAGADSAEARENPQGQDRAE
jgi:hypothetical protein